MSNLSVIYANLLTNLGLKADVASSSGSANAKLAQLLARIESATLYEGTQVLPVIYPNLANPAEIVAGATAGTFGSYVDLVAASVLTGHSLVGLHFSHVGSSPTGTWAVEIAEGAAGAEVVKWRATYTNAGAINFTHSTLPDWFFPGYKVAANARVSARVTHSTNNALTLKVWAIFAPRPF